MVDIEEEVVVGWARVLKEDARKEDNDDTLRMCVCVYVVGTERIEARRTKSK